VVALRVTSLKCCALMCMRYIGTLIYLEQFFFVAEDIIGTKLDVGC